MKVGVLGGSFDPVHLGHLRAAAFALEAFSLDEVRLVPARRSPFKPEAVASAEDRMRMVELATRGEAGLSSDRIEIDREAPSYTVETLRVLRDREPRVEVTLIVGSDALASFDSWKEATEIRRLADVKALQRPGAPAVPGAVAFPGSLISSSDIRELVRTGRSIRFLVPEPVRAYIEARMLYA